MPLPAPIIPLSSIPAAAADPLAALRARVRRIERPAIHGTLPFGLAAIDRALPGGGLALGAVHEILGAGNDEEDGAVPAAFAAAILGRLGKNPLPKTSCLQTEALPYPFVTPAKAGVQGKRGDLGALDSRFRGNDEGQTGSGTRSRPHGASTVLWCLPRADLYGPGLAQHGLDPARLVLVAARRDDEILWAVEEGLRASCAEGGLVAVVGEVGHLPMVASRRLQLAAERSGITALVLRRWRSGTAAEAERERPSAATTRWRIAALPAAGIADMPGLGRPRWRVELLRCRGGEPAAWEVEVADATGHVSLSAELADRPAPPRHRADASPTRRAG